MIKVDRSYKFNSLHKEYQTKLFCLSVKLKDDPENQFLLGQKQAYKEILRDLSIEVNANKQDLERKMY